MAPAADACRRSHLDRRPAPPVGPAEFGLMLRIVKRCAATVAVLGPVFSTIVASTTTARGQASYPMVMDVWPLAVQTGSTAKLRVTARYNLYGTYQVFVTGEGVK